MIEFHCKNCGRQINIPDVHAGKTGKCPNCASIIAVPGTGSPGAVTRQSSSAEPETGSQNSVYDLTLLDIPPKNKIQDQPISQTNGCEKAVKSQQEPTAEEIESATQRKLPWLIDFFLYPVSKAGITILGIVVVMRFLLRIVVLLLGGLSLQIPLFLIPFAMAWIIGILVRIVLYLYLYWYLCECIRDSAAGGTRAPETIGHNPGFGEMLGQAIMTIGCFLFFLVPAFLYHLKTGQTDTIFCRLPALAALFFFPMSLLAVVTFDSFKGLNPIVLIGSILSTFLPYCAMIMVLVWAGFFIIKKAPALQELTGSAFILWCLGIYLAMVAAHLLGWFYHRYERQLNWDV
jgi:DNA-directed RNA polymerase subunit RPC12/RpoP